MPGWWDAIKQQGKILTGPKKVSNPFDALGDVTGVQGNFLENLLGAPDEDAKAHEYMQKALESYDGLAPPDLAELNLDEYDYQGDFTPTLLGEAPRISESRLGPSAMEDVNADPRLVQAQMDALASLQEISGNGGLTASDRAQLSRVQNEVSQADRGRREAIQQGMAARGAGGSGMDLLAQLQSSQAATDRSAQMGLDVAGMAQNRALDAMSRGGSLAGSMRSQGFGEGAQKAQSKDAIDRFNSANRMQADMFNASNKMDTNRFNVGTQNEAGMANRTNRQNLANANVDTRNKEKGYNAGLGQQRFENEMSVASGKAGAYGAGSDFWSKRGDRKSQMKGNIFGAGVGVGTAALTKSDERAKTDIQGLSDNELTEFLTALKPKSFKYKDPAKDGSGDKVGFLMQDVADTSLGQKIMRETDDGQMAFDSQSMDGILLAALKKLSEDEEAA